jgi:hypothetical protein
MKDNRFICFLASRGICIAVWLLLVGLAQTTAFSQCAPSAPPASVRGTALVQDSLVVGGITVVAIATDAKGRRCGGSVRAPVNNAGEYRFDNIASGHYTFVAMGRPIKRKVVQTAILPGYGNELNISLETAATRTQARLREGDNVVTSLVVYRSPASAREVKAHHR